MSIRKYKPGDKVMVKHGLVSDADYDGCYCNSLMADMGGVHLTIERIDRDAYGGAYKMQETGWVFVDEMLDPYNILLEQKICCFREASEFETRYEPTDISSVVNLYGGN